MNKFWKFVNLFVLILTRLPVSNHAIFHDEFIERNREKGRKNLNLFFSILKRSKIFLNEAWELQRDAGLIGIQTL